MESDPKSAPNAADGLRALAQPVAAPLTRAAIFPGRDSKTGLRELHDRAVILRRPRRADSGGGVLAISKLAFPASWG